VTELVINAVKYAFPTNRGGARILVTYESGGADWKLVVSDNGVGKTFHDTTETPGGLGTVIVQALVKQLEARMDVLADGPGMTVAITRGTVTSRMPKAA
jgi:two-component sensor histidine kinase